MIFQDSIANMRKYAQQHVSLRVSNGEQAWRSLLSAGIKAEFHQDLVTMQEQSDEKVAQAVRVLVRDGLSVYRVVEEKPSLEDVFLQMTTKERAE